MQDIPEEYIVKYGLHEAAHFWTEYLTEKRISGRVPVLVDDFMISLFFVECDRYGYPMRLHTDFLSFLENPSLASLVEGNAPPTTIDHVYKKTLRIEKPILTKQFGDYMSQPYVFMWEGTIVDKREVPIDSLDVKKLLRLAQEVVISREGLVVDEVLKNKLIK